MSEPLPGDAFGDLLRLRVRDGNRATDWFEYWLLTVTELEDVLRASPWRLPTVERSDDDPVYAVVLTRR